MNIYYISVGHNSKPFIATAEVKENEKTYRVISSYPQIFKVILNKKVEDIFVSDAIGRVSVFSQNKGKAIYLWNKGVEKKLTEEIIPGIIETFNNYGSLSINRPVQTLTLEDLKGCIRIEEQEDVCGK